MANHQTPKKFTIKSDLGTEQGVKDHSYRDEAIGLTAGSQVRRRVLTQNLIDRYYQRKLITPRQYNTAQYLHSIYTKGSRTAGMKYDVRVDGGGASNDDSAVGFSDYMKAMKLLPGEMFRVVQWIVIDGCSATSLDQQIHNGRRMSMQQLRKALDKLSEYFGIL